MLAYASFRRQAGEAAATSQHLRCRACGVHCVRYRKQIAFHLEWRKANQGLYSNTRREQVYSLSYRLRAQNQRSSLFNEDFWVTQNLGMWEAWLCGVSSEKK